MHSTNSYKTKQLIIESKHRVNRARFFLFFFMLRAFIALPIEQVFAMQCRASIVYLIEESEHDELKWVSNAWVVRQKQALYLCYRILPLRTVQFR